MVYDVIIIGGGAAGLFCAANTELKNGKGLVLESMKQTGIKLMAAGSGQCNLPMAEIFAILLISTVSTAVK